MTRIDFHTNVPDKIAYACRLVRKAYLARNQVVLLAEDAQQLAALNGALWTLSDTDYLPHVLAGDALAPHTPIVLTDSDDTTVPLPHHDILINLSSHTPAHFGQFQRVFEIVSQEEQDAEAGRKRYAFYKRESWQPTHFVAGKT
ncbi:DNA polymerase III subunit chi [Janthinobacterium agaricidamnosum]|uniref:DNA polymerase III chi subunit, HolC family protein n=1 Tax=Janthinobacterium agaricidamnosum NBRC 102515 = DSM 9628 TaxID=1349767 RepID=W0V1J5_9BURK|nr:DNA polymerase III subunit chi [Janthinobacterium agaricidamnosum]CDG81751.1 DNA polymerase III chi subunit, HolC family protein [Janthinobacterium agaricidamnosum NBRC 102515 = DSM 9628]